MSGTSPKLSARQSHKQLLIAESEVNRQLLIHECRAAAAGIQELSQEIKQVGTLASSLALIFAGFSAIRQKPAEVPAPRRGLFSRIVEGARFGTSLWKAFRRK